MFVCTKVAGATFRLRKGRQQRFRPIDGQPRGACSTVVCKRTATPLADIYDSLVAIIVHTAARTSTTRFAPPGAGSAGDSEVPSETSPPSGCNTVDSTKVAGTTSDCIKGSGSTFACAKVAGSTI